MKTLPFALLAAGLLALSGGAVGQQKKDDKPEAKEPAAKSRGQLPQGWGKLGLSADQKQKVYAIDSEYDVEIDKLTKKIADLKKERYKKQLDVLTADQKKALEENAKKKASGEK
jgi:Spy/CpxP family protein refolding chaperone